MTSPTQELASVVRGSPISRTPATLTGAAAGVKGAGHAAPAPIPANSDLRDALREAKGRIVAHWFQLYGPRRSLIAPEYRQHGWQLWKPRPPESVCVLTAVKAATVGCRPGTKSGVYALLYAALGVRFLFRLDCWNDAPGRTHAEVVDLFDRALLALDAPQSPSSPAASWSQAPQAWGRGASSASLTLDKPSQGV